MYLVLVRHSTLLHDLVERSAELLVATHSVDDQTLGLGHLDKPVEQSSHIVALPLSFVSALKTQLEADESTHGDFGCKVDLAKRHLARARLV